MLKYILLFLALSFVTEDSLSQSNTTNKGHLENMSAARLRNSGVTTFDKRERGFDGSFLLFDNWKNGIIYFEDNTAPIDVEALNYNINTRQFILKSAGKEYGLFLQDTKEITVADLSNTGEFVERKFRKIVSENYKIELAEIIVNNQNTALYKVNTYKVAKSNYQPALDQGSINDKVVKSYVYYLGINGEFLLLPTNRKKAMKKFSTQKQLSKYLQTHKVNMKEEGDLIALTNYLNLNTEK